MPADQIHENSILEPGNVRFDILQSADDPAKFVFYEAYKTPQDAAAHKTNGIIWHGVTLWRTGWLNPAKASFMTVCIQSPTANV